MGLTHYTPVFALLVSLLFLGCIQQSNPTNNLTDLQTSGVSSTPSASISAENVRGFNGAYTLPGICSSGSECSDYCTANWRKCVEYCKANPSNSLCVAYILPSLENARGEQGDSSRGNYSRGGVQQEVHNSAVLPSCGDKTILFNSTLVPFDRVFMLTPLGQASPPDHVFPAPHQYAYLIDWQHPADSSVPVYAPGDLVLTQIGLRHYNKIGSAVDYTDYTLVFQPCSDFYLYFHHLRTLEFAPFKQVADEMRQSCSFSSTRNEDYCSKEVNIPIPAGTLFAQAGDLKASVYGFDIGARDYRAKDGMEFADAQASCPNGERNIFSRCYTVCAFDYFSPEAKKDIVFSAGGGDSPKISGLSCGNVHFDVAGSLQGYWFKAGEKLNTFSPESDNFYLGPNNLNPASYIISVGNAIPGLKPGRYDFKMQVTGSSNLDPGFAKPGGTYCFTPSSNNAGVQTISLKIEFLNSTSIRVSAGSSSSCDFAASDYGAFER